MKEKIMDLIKATLFLSVLFFAGSGALECCVLKLLELVGW